VLFRHVCRELALRALKDRAGGRSHRAGVRFSGKFSQCRRDRSTTGCWLTSSPTTGPRPGSVAGAVGPPPGQSSSLTCTAAGRHEASSPVGPASTKLRVVEDACPGARRDAARQNGPAPGGTWAVMSFGGSKLLTAAAAARFLTRHAACLSTSQNLFQRGNQAFPLTERKRPSSAPQVHKPAERNGDALPPSRACMQKGAAAAGPATDREPTRNPKLLQAGLAVRAERWAVARSMNSSRPHGRRASRSSGLSRFFRRGERPLSQGWATCSCRARSGTTLVLHHPTCSSRWKPSIASPPVCKKSRRCSAAGRLDPPTLHPLTALRCDANRADACGARSASWHRCRAIARLQFAAQNRYVARRVDGEFHVARRRLAAPI